MKQVALRLRDGRVEVVDVPAPSPSPECVLVNVRASVLSIGTERSKVEAGRESLIGKARARPDQARQVIEKARRDGVADAIRAVRTRLDQPTALGYSAAGVVLDVGRRVRGLSPGDRVACGGGEYAVHADVVQVPGNLCVPVPINVDFEAAAFAAIASVAMHGVRQADARLGERVGVIGLGLVGQLTGQILHAAGCRVIGIDLDPSLVTKARDIRSIDVGYERAALNPLNLPRDASDCDAVIITAATRSSDPIELAANLLRDRGRVVVVGDVRVDVPRATYYEREVDIRFSRSYGPGRYDREYEERGLDYPIGYVRWTEQRNMSAFLELLAIGRVDIGALVVERVRVDAAAEVYERLASTDSSPLGVVLEYEPSEAPTLVQTRSMPTRNRATAPIVNVIGAGSFAQRILIPRLRKAGFTLGAVASAKGLSAKGAADRFGFARVGSPEELLADPHVGLIAIATRHSSHAVLAEAGLRAGRPVFVEKPPCLTSDELHSLRAARSASHELLFVGFNRRYAPLAIVLRDHVRDTGAPIELLCRVSAGPLPDNHWLNHPEEGGGRLLGEGCHFVDFASWVVGSVPVSVHCTMRPDPDRSLVSAQNFTVLLDFAEGSVATIIYTARGADKLGKEYVEAHSAGRSALLDDFRRLTLFGGRLPRRTRGRQDKGHAAQFVHLRRLLTGDIVGAVDPDPLDSMSATLAALEDALRNRRLPESSGDREA